jgi:hypothetical protein
MDSRNRGYFFAEAMDSDLSQDFPADRFDLLVVVDGATGDTAGRIRRVRHACRFSYQD